MMNKLLTLVMLSLLLALLKLSAASPQATRRAGNTALAAADQATTRPAAYAPTQ